MSRLVVATGNRGKVAEIRGLVSELGFQVSSLLEMREVPEIVEDGETFEENALRKATIVRDVAGCAVLADDSGLVVDALDGRPGIHSARYGGEGLDDRRRYELLLEEMRDVPDDARAARFVCALAFAEPGEEPVTFRGVFEGTIARRPAGDNGFGYDPVFTPAGRDVTLAQLSAEEKRRTSHRARALASLAGWLATRNISRD